MTVAGGVVERLAAMEPLLLVLRASLLVLLVNSNDDPGVMVAVAVVCLVALPRPALLRSPWLWAALFAGVGARQLATWHTIDDHVVVTTYWCGAIALALRARDALATLAVSARLLVGTLFAFAAGWKLFSGQFLDGTFFRYTLLFDERFEVVARSVGGTTDAMRGSNVAAVNQLLAGGGGGEVVLREGPGSPDLALVFTGWGLLVELAMAAVFLLPLGRRRHLQRARHAALATFAVTTYAVVPVGGFGALLLVLGAAQTESDRGRIAYMAGAVALLAWAALWPALFLS